MPRSSTTQIFLALRLNTENNAFIPVIRHLVHYFLISGHILMYNNNNNNNNLVSMYIAQECSVFISKKFEQLWLNMMLTQSMKSQGEKKTVKTSCRTKCKPSSPICCYACMHAWLGKLSLFLWKRRPPFHGMGYESHKTHPASHSIHFLMNFIIHLVWNMEFCCLSAPCCT